MSFLRPSAVFLTFFFFFFFFRESSICSLSHVFFFCFFFSGVFDLLQHIAFNLSSAEILFVDVNICDINTNSVQEAYVFGK